MFVKNNYAEKLSPLCSSAYDVTNLHGAPAANVNVKIMTINIGKPLFYIMQCILMDMSSYLFH